jgi:DNA-binding transcriptional LysR family regulator
MNDRTANGEPDWSLWRSFAAVVVSGSLTGAAKMLGLSQPTVGRHIDALEASLGVTLFDRTMLGFHPTETALMLYEPVGDAGEAIARAVMAAQGLGEELSGTVRITASEVVAHYVLPGMIMAMRQDYPEIQLELVPTDSPENLLMHEADIAIRMFRPTQLELVTRKIGETPIVACAHESYLARRGTPQKLDELTEHDIIGFDRSDLIIRVARDNGLDVDRNDFVLRSDSQTLFWELLKAGLGIGFAQRQLVRRTPGLVEILPDLKIPPLEVWLTTHSQLFTSRRIRAIYDRLADLLDGYIHDGQGASMPAGGN